MADSNEHYGAREVFRTHKEVARNPTTGNKNYSLEQARAIAEHTSEMGGRVRGEVLDWTNFFLFRVIEVYEKGARIK